MKIFKKNKLIFFFYFYFLSVCAQDLNISFQSWFYAAPSIFYCKFLGLINYYAASFFSKFVDKKITDAFKDLEQSNQELQRMRKRGSDFALERQKKEKDIGERQQVLTNLISVLEDRLKEVTEKSAVTLEAFAVQQKQCEDELEKLRNHIESDLNQQGADNKENLDTMNALFKQLVQFKQVQAKNKKMLELIQSHIVRKNTLNCNILRRTLFTGSNQKNKIENSLTLD